MNINDWLLEDKVLYNINLGDSLNSALKKLNDYECTLVGEDDYGYYYIENGYRFGFSDSKVDEIGVDFLQSKSDIFFKTKESKINLSKAKIHKVLDFLNDSFIKWSPVKSVDSNALIFELEKSNIFLIFDVYEGTLDKITKSILTKEKTTSI